MAHSNRQKLRDSRGGLTKNQLRKKQKASSSSGSNRLQETINWLAELEEKKKVKVNQTVEAKVVKFSKLRRVIERRERVIKRLEEQLKTDGHPLKLYKDNNSPAYEFNVKRIKKELNTLKSRV